MEIQVMIDKSEFLGTNYGAATQKLRKFIIFKLLVKHGENICFQCGNTIENVDDLSVEHIKPWLGKRVDLFWDLDNIAFSHLACNRRASSGGFKKGHTFRAHKVSEGNSFCAKCLKELPLDNFHKNKTRFRGVEKYCKSCRNKIRKVRI
jgi:hypothetical protein